MQVEELAGKGVDIDAEDTYGWTAVRVSVPNSQCTCRTPLRSAML